MLPSTKPTQTKFFVCPNHRNTKIPKSLKPTSYAPNPKPRTSLHFTAEETRPVQRKADPKVQQVYDPGKKGTCRPRHAKRNKPDAPRRRTGTRHQGLETRQPRETGLKRSTQSARRSRQEQTCRWGAASRNGPAGSNPKESNDMYAPL